MIDIKLIRTNPDLVKANIKKREMNLDSVVDEILEIDAKRRELTGSTEAMKAEQNACTKKIPAMKKAGEDVAPVMAEMKALSEKIKAADAELGEIEAKQQELMLGLPNMPDEDVAAGGKEQNVPVHYFGEQPKFDFEPKNHVDLCESLGMDCSCKQRLPVADAFKSATGDIRDRITVRRDGEQKFYQIYCRENKSTPNVLSRELVKETVNQRTNQYEKLANIHYDKADQRFGYDDLAYDEDVDAMKYCLQAERLFELYQVCANRKQIETICLKYLRSLEATKVSVNGHLYFVPRHTMEQVAVFETFFEELSRLNRNNTPLLANSFYLIDDAKQRDKMTEEFYLAVKKEIAQYQERADYFIQSGCSSPSTMERWVVKIQALEEKKRRYEDILRRELTGLDDEFESLRLLSQELSLRARGLRSRKAA